MITDANFPEGLQYKPSKVELDDAVNKAKGVLLNDIKRSIYLYRCDLGGCNGCEIEIFASLTSVFDVERFGIKNTPSPRHADIMVYTGAVTRATRMPGLRAYEQAPDPKIVVSYGACGCTGGIFHDNYSVWGGTDQIIPVDVFIPGCPPSPAQTIYGFAMALGLVEQKLHEEETHEGKDEKASVRFDKIPYKVRVAVEREARIMAGYRYGRDLADEFLTTVMLAEMDVEGAVASLISNSEDPRRKEVYAALNKTMMSYVLEDVR